VHVQHVIQMAKLRFRIIQLQRTTALEECRPPPRRNRSEWLSESSGVCIS